MAGSTFGTLFKITTFGESHGKSIGVIIDGCPSGIELDEEDIQKYLDRRKPVQNDFSTTRLEEDKCEIFSGVFEGKTTGTSIMVMVYNNLQNSSDYSEIASYYRPGHADFTYDNKYGFRDYRGGGRSSGRETIARVVAGAVAAKVLGELNINVQAFTESVGGIYAKQLNISEINENPFFIPDNHAARLISGYISQLKENKDSCGGTISCIVAGMPVGIGEPVFDKLDAEISKAVMSIGAVKGIEFGIGFLAANMNGSECNDEFGVDERGKIYKKTNNSGGVLGGLSDGDLIVLRAVIKPPSSIGLTQTTVNNLNEEIQINIDGRHDVLIVPRAVVVVESMVAITILDLLLRNMCSKIENVKRVYE